MADLNVGALKGSIQVDFGSVRKAEQAVKSLQGQFSSYVKAANKAASSEKARIRALGQVESNLKKLSATQKNQVNATKDSNAAISRAVSATKSYQAAVEGYGASSTEAVKAQVRMKSAIEDANSSVKAATNNAKAQVAAKKENERITRKSTQAMFTEAKAVKTTTLSVKEQEAALTRAVKAETQIKIARRNSAASTHEGRHALQQAEKALREYNALLEDSSVDANRLATAQGKLSRSIEHARVTTTGLNSATANTRTWFRSSRAAASQFGLQLQDVAVQAQSGTNALVILGQQGSQLLGFFGAGGALAGAILAVGAAVAYLTSAAGESKSALSDMSDALQRANDIAEKSNGVYQLRKEFEYLAQASESVAKTRILATLQSIEDASRASAQGIAVAFGDLDISELFGLKDLETFTRTYGDLEAYLQSGLVTDSVEDLGEMFGFAGREANAAGRDILKMLTTARVEGTPSSILELEEGLSGLVEQSGNASEEAFRLISSLEEYFSKARTAEERTNFLKRAYEDLQSALSGSTEAMQISELWSDFESLFSEVDEGYARTIKLNRAWMILTEAGREFGIEQSKLVEIMDKYADSLDETSSNTKTAYDEAKEYIATLKEQAETVGLSEKALVRHTIEKLADKDASIKNKEALIDEAQAYVQQTQAAERRLEQMKEEKERRKQILDQMQSDYQTRMQFMFGDRQSEIQTQSIRLLSSFSDDEEGRKRVQQWQKEQENLLAMQAEEVSTSPFSDIETLELELAQRKQTLQSYYDTESQQYKDHLASMEQNAANAKPFLQFANGAQTASDIVGSAMETMQAAGRENAKEFQALALAQTIISQAMAVSKIWATADNFYVAAAQSALAGAAVGAQIAQIKSQNFANGGLVRGPGTGRSDDVPANLSNGEFVMQAEAVRRIGVNQLNAMNQGRAPNFANGGSVGATPVMNGGDTTVNVIDQRSGGAPVETQESVDQNGNKRIEVLIKDMVNQGMMRGDFDKTMGASFGIRRPGRRV